MWQCPECKYWNDEPAQRCERCEAERDEEPDAPAESHDTRESAPLQLDIQAAAPAGKRWSVLERVALAVILVCVLVLGAVALLLWRGGLSLADLTGGANQGEGQGGTTAVLTPASGGAEEEAAAEHPLEPIYADDQRGLGQLRPFADEVMDYEEQAGGLAAPALGGGALPPEAADYLARLRELGEELLDSYESFAAEAPDWDDPDLDPYVKLLRDGYQAAMADVLGRIGAVYSRDDYGQYSAYGLSDTLAAAVEAVDPARAEELRAVWLTYVGERQEFLLNQAQVEETRRLSALEAGLREIRDNFQRSLNQLPPYTAHNGLLDGAGRDTLDLLELLATNIEVAVGEYEEYVATLSVAELSRANRDLMSRFLDLAQQDHLYAFTETYRIYAQDRRLEHPAYGRLAEHYAFVEEHWPELQMSYRRVYSNYEAEWAAMWAND